MDLALALDLGTTSISALAVGEEGRIVAQAGRPNTATVPGRPPGHAEQDPQTLLRLAVEVLRELTGQISGSPRCLGVTGQMHGTLLVDRERRPLTNLITWQDRRALEPHPATGKTHLQEYLARCSETDLAATGCRLSPGYLGVTLFVLSEQRQIPAGAHRAAFLADWIAAELCDGSIVTDRTHAGSSGIYDLQHDAWSAPLLEAGRLRGTLLPEVRESSVPVGRMSGEFAAQTGLPDALPVANAVGDNQAALLGSLPDGKPAIQINVGTGGQINWPIDGFRRIPGMDTRSLPPGRFMVVGAGLAGGDAYAWVNRTAAGWLRSLHGDASPDEIYARINALAADVPPGCDGLSCDPVFRGTRRRPDARGSLTGITFENFTMGHVARAVLEGIAGGLYSFYENAGDARPEHLRQIVGSGNALRKNPLLVEILAQAFGRDVRLPAHREEAAYGAALLAGTHAGLWPDLRTAARGITLT